MVKSGGVNRSSDSSDRSFRNISYICILLPNFPKYRVTKVFQNEINL